MKKEHPQQREREREEFPKQRKLLSGDYFKRVHAQTRVRDIHRYTIYTQPKQTINTKGQNIIHQIATKSSESHIVKENEVLGARAESTHKGVNERSKDITPTQQQRPESQTMFFHGA